ncbi:MAG: AAA family ATPase [Nanoarchaeota archaeon]|nr:AAA family ATPase [Nanoarchaeota archaeon]
MIIKSINLKNIRSYVSQEIQLPKGNLLLSGNVGAGKSTILLAVEFALFGTRRPGLSGASLLRNGQDTGSVELEFYIEDTHIKIKRNLRRTNNSVAQESGFLSIAGHSTQLTPLELKQRILELLNYPREFLTKSKSLIYRYTVYTPQEQMKQILTQGKDLRLDMLRRVFGIDKYKTIKENSRILITAIKEKRKELQGFISDLQEKTSLLLQKQEKSSKIQQKLPPITEKICILSKDITQKKEKLQDLELKKEHLNELKKQSEIKKAEITSKESYLKRIKKERENIEASVFVLQQELAGKKDKGTIDSQISQTKEKINLNEQSLIKTRKEIESIRTTINLSQNIINEISKLATCPTCRQEVRGEHKKKITSAEQEKISSLNEKLNFLLEEEKQLISESHELKPFLEALQKKKANQELIIMKFRNLEEKKSTTQKYSQEIQALSIEIQDLNASVFELSKKLQNIDTSGYDLLKNAIQSLEEQTKSFEIEQSSLKATLSAISEDINTLTQEIHKKTESKNKLEYLNKLLFWIEHDFTSLIESIEKQVMIKINFDFNELFRKWFILLMDDENIQVSLDNEFTPIITQNSHEMDYEHLSGGEKTAAALAYRLSLNQVINNLMSNIKTNDLLILDEPTDGFSEQQLERIHDVLEELNIAQVIIVSHESKIESFVDNIIKITKHNHVSSVS